MIGVSLREIGEHFPDFLPPVPLLIFGVCLKQGILQDFLGFTEFERMAVGFGRLIRLFLGGISITLEGKNLRFHGFPLPFGKPIPALFEDLVVFVCGLVTEGDAVTAVSSESAGGILLVIGKESLECLGIVAQLE